LAVVLRDFLDLKAIEVARFQPKLPALYSYRSDATSYLTGSSERSRICNKLVVRDGRVLTELLIERGYILVLRGSGSIKSAIVVRMPRLLLDGKSSWHTFTASCQFFQPPFGITAELASSSTM